MGNTTSLRQAIKRVFIPHLADKGFAVDMRRAPQFLTFRRITRQGVHVCDIQWDKYGRPRFIVNFGRCGSQGVVIRGQPIPPADIFPFDTPEAGRLAPGRRRTTAGWYRQDRSLIGRLFARLAPHPAQDVIGKLVVQFDEVEDLWAAGRVGAHIRLFRRATARTTVPPRISSADDTR
jgi:hypothetical protein